jgi:hypothetical protein
MDMRFATWDVRSIYRAGSLVTVSKFKCQVRFSGSAAEYTFFYGK